MEDRMVTPDIDTVYQIVQLDPSNLHWAKMETGVEDVLWIRSGGRDARMFGSFGRRHLGK